MIWMGWDGMGWEGKEGGWMEHKEEEWDEVKEGWMEHTRRRVGFGERKGDIWNIKRKSGIGMR